MPVLQNGELILYGFVGDSYWEQGFTSQEVLSALAELGREADVTVRMNSGGGYVHEGLAIYNALAAHRGKVTVQVESIVASSASLIAMAGDSIVMKAGSLLMIHDPAGITYGTAEDHEKTRISLDKMGDTFASIYAERSGKDAGEVREAMKGELWLTADEAVSEGYADEAEGAKAKPASAFDYRLYAHAPKRLVAMARAKNWSLPATAAASAAPTAQQKEKSMGDQPKADDKPADLDKIRAEAAEQAVKADRDRRGAILALDEAKGRETLAEHLYLTGATAEQAKATLALAPAGKADEEQVEDYAGRRSRASGLAQPGGQSQPKARASISSSAVYASRRTALKGA